MSDATAPNASTPVSPADQKDVVIVGDPTSHGGMVITGSPTHSVQGRPVARLGDLVECPQYYPDGRPHGKNPILQGSYKMLVDGIPVALHGHHSECGCTLLAGGLDPNTPVPNASQVTPSNETQDEKDNHLFGENRPDLEKLTKEPAVRDGINSAWNQTLADGNEHGGWILRNPDTNQISVQPWPTGGPDTVGGADPVLPPDAIASFHTHPPHGIDPYVIRAPSHNDLVWNAQSRISGIVRSPFGYYFYGPSNAPPIYPEGAVPGMDQATYTPHDSVIGLMQRMGQIAQNRVDMDNKKQKEDDDSLAAAGQSPRPKVAG